MPLAPIGLVGSGNPTAAHLALMRDVEDRRRLVVVQPRREAGAVVRVVDQLLAADVADALDAAAVDLAAQAVRVNHRADVGHADEIDDGPDAGLDVDLDFGERGHEAVGLAVARQVVARHAHQPAALVRGRRRLGHGVDFLRHFGAVVDAAELDRALRPPCAHVIAQAAALADHTLRVGVVVVRRAAHVLRGNLLQLLLEVHARRVVRAGVRVGRLAAGLDRDPRQALRRVAPDHFAVLPRHVDHFGDHARGVAERLRAEVADALVDFELAVGPQDAEAVDADRAGGVGAGADGRRRVTLLPVRWPLFALRASQLNISAPLSSALLDEAAGQLVARTSRPACSAARGRTAAWPSGAFILRIAT